MSDQPTLLGPGTWVQPGPATLVVREPGWAILVPGLRKEVIEAAWTVLGEGPEAEAFMDRLVEEAGLEGPDKISALLFGLAEGTSASFGVKGRTPISVYSAAGQELVAGTEDEPFVIRSFEDVRRVSFGELPPEESLGLPRIDAGITRARGFVHALVDPAELDEDQRAALAEQVEADGRSIEDPEAKQRKAEKPPPSTPAASTPAATSTSSTPLRRPAIATRKSGEMPPTIASRGGGGSSSSAGAAPAAPTGPSVFDDLFADRAPSPGTADPAAEAAPAPATPAPAAPEPEPPALEPEPGPPAHRAADPAGGSASPAETDSAVPAAGSAQEDAARVVGGSAPPAEEDEASAPSAASARAADHQAPAPLERPPAPRRRLVSTSLFDRRRRGSTPSPAAGGETPEAPDTAASPGAAALETAASPDPAPRSVPTPEPPDEDDSDSPVTLVAPIDDAVLEAPQPGAEQETLAPRPADAGHAASPPGSEVENSGAYDDLFGKTVFRRIEDAAVRRRDEDEEHDKAPVKDGDPVPDEPPAEAEPQRIEEQPSAMAPPEPAAADAASAAIGGDFIDWVPGVGREAPEIAHTAARRAGQPQQSQPAYPQVHMPDRPPAPQAPAPGQAWDGHAAPPPSGPPQHPGRHASAPHPVAPPVPPPALSAPGARQGPPPRGHAPQLHPPAHPAQEAAPGPGDPGQHPGAPGQSAGSTAGVVTLPGLVCPDGHANSPERSECRACRAPLEGRTRTVARPPLGTVAISTGDSFVLDRTAIIGRRPRASRVSGSDVPQLITVPSPQQDISRSHVELRLEGWHVVALDLGTTNGTTLYRPGAETVRLRPREGVMLHAGDQLDLGDGVKLLVREMV